MQLIISEQFQEYMSNLGIDLNDTLQKAGVNKVIWKENLELNDSEYWRLMDEFDNELNDDTILSFADISHMSNFMPSFFAAMSAKNGASALKRLSEYKALVGPVHLNVKNDDTTTKITISGNDLKTEPPRFTVMTEQLLLINSLRVGTSKKIDPVKVASSYSYGKVIPNTLGVKTSYSSQNELIFNSDDLKINFLSANNTMWKFIQPELNRKKLEIESHKSLTDNLQAILLKKIPSAEFGIDDIAKIMGISRRTLQRNLKNLDTSFNDQVKYARQTLVNPLMKDETLSLVDISYLLGYADPESFSRAFKTWYHDSPSVYRKQLIVENNRT